MKIPSSPMRQAILAPTLAIEAQMMKRLGVVLSSLKSQLVMKMIATATKESEAPVLSMAIRMRIWSWLRGMVAIVRV